MFFSYLFHRLPLATRTATPLINRNATVFAAKPAVFLRPGRQSQGPGLRLAGSGRGAHFQGEDVRKMRIRGWGHKIKETKRLPVYVSMMRKSTKTTLFRLID